jgi:hypothetical protein
MGVISVTDIIFEILPKKMKCKIPVVSPTLIKGLDVANYRYRLVVVPLLSPVFSVAYLRIANTSYRSYICVIRSIMTNDCLLPVLKHVL